MENNHISCPTHCCKEHGCKYRYHDCPVATGKVKGTGCEECGLIEDGYYDPMPKYEHTDSYRLWELAGRPDGLIKEEIKIVARRNWEVAGRPNGRDLEFWLNAEKEIETAYNMLSPEQRVRRSFGARIFSPNKIR